jgi:hypothetical protein
MAEEELIVQVSIPFPNKRAAQIAYNVLSIDQEPKRSQVKKQYTIDNNILSV